MTKNHETAEDTWINYSIQGLEDPHRPFNYSKYQTWNSIAVYNSKVISKVDEYLSNINQEDLGRIVWRTNNDGITRRSKVKDILMHLITEELHYRGEIIAILWQMNIRPPDMGWLSAMQKTDPIWVMK